MVVFSLRAVTLSAFVCLLLAAYSSAQVVTSDKGLTYETTITWAPNTISGAIGFLVAARSSTTGYYYWGTREWIGVVESTQPFNQSAVKTIQRDLGANPQYNNIVLNETNPERAYGWFTKMVEESLWRFELSDPTNTLVKFYQRENTDNRQFRGLLYEPTQDVLWILCDNDVIWVDPLQEPEAEESDSINYNSESGKVQNILNGAQLRTILLDTKQNMVYMAGNAIVFRTPASNNAIRGQFRRLELESKVIGAGLYYTGIMYSAQEKLYLGSDLGIGVEVDIPTFSLRRIFFAPGETFYSVYLDEEHNTLFWSTDKASVIRVNTDDFQIFAKITVEATNLKAVVHDPLTQRLHYGADFGISFQTFQVMKTNCTPYSCRECFTVDTQYCGVCKETGVCTIESACNGTWEDVNSQEAFCPDVISVDPPKANTAGGTRIVIEGTYFEPQDTKCLFRLPEGDVIVNPVSIQQTRVTCDVPPRPLQTTETDLVSVGVIWKQRIWGDLMSFLYYNCSLMDCDTCFSTTSGVRSFPECGWCLETLSCSAMSTCPVQQSFITSSCPAVTQVYPPTGSVSGNEAIDVTVSSLYNGPYYCKFGSNELVDAVSIEPNKLRCNSPPNTQTQATTSVEVSIYTGATRETSVEFTPRRKQFTYYDCTLFTTCQDCNDPSYPLCQWCGADVLTCGFMAGSSCSTPAAQCPTIHSVSPDSVPLEPYDQPTLQISGVAFEDVSNLVCSFQPISGGAVVTTSAQFVGDTLVICDTPDSPQDAEYYVWLSSGGVTLTNKMNVLFYKCSSATSCENCLDARKSSCFWCNHGSSLSCGVSGMTCAEELFSSVSACPSISSITPTGDAIQGGTTIILTGEFDLLVDQSGSFQCEFEPPTGSPDGTLTTVASVVVESESQQIHCKTPNVSTVGEWTVRVKRNGKTYSKAHSFNFYDCSELESCTECLSFSHVGCTWCATSCSAKTQCHFDRQLTACPTITRAEPDYAFVDGGETIRVFGGRFISPDASTYTCVFDGLSTPGRRSGVDTMECTTPRRATGNATLTIQLDGIPYTVNSVKVNFFTCTSGLTSCSDTCSSSDHCGWCISSPSSCTSQSKCTGLWVPKCLMPELVQNHATIGGNETIPVKFDDVESPLPSAVTDNPADIICEFGDIATRATVVRQSDASYINCVTPAVRGPGPAQFTVYFRDAVLLRTQFMFVDCSHSECGVCASVPYCGWCLDENKCTTRSFCPLGNWTETVCPRIDAISPASGLPDSPTPVTISGFGIIPSNMLSVRIGGVDTPISEVRVLSQTTYQGEIDTIAPGSEDKQPATVSVELLFNGSLYATNTLQFRYENPKAVDPGALGGGLAAGLVVLGAIGVFAFIKLRQKYANAVKVTVKEPDYNAVAWGSDAELHYKIPEEGYKKLEICLSRSDFALQLAIQAVCPPTEQEALAKSLIHVAHSLGKAVSLINCLVKVEVDSCIQENTIFRGNSLVSKMFKFYSRIVGIRYLFRSMARVIAELEILGLKESRKKAKGQKNEGSSLLSVSMELDPSKMGDSEQIDAETNLLQLQLTCQKIFSVVLKSANQGFPVEFRTIFIRIDECMMQKFGSDEASFKAIGGFFFLRFVCPAITAPHVYGLLDHPPNNLTQRQLVLISKVIQSVANMAVPGKKEKYMEALASFISSGIPKIVNFYKQIRVPQYMDQPQIDMPTPKEVKLNALSTIWNFIYLNQDKVKCACGEIGLDRVLEDEIVGTLEELVYEYKTAPKKLVAQKKKKKGQAAAAVPADV